MCECNPNQDEPQPGWEGDPDHWLICPARELDQPRNLWVYRVQELYRHYITGNLSCFVPSASETLSAALITCDTATRRLDNWRVKQSLKQRDNK